MGSLLSTASLSYCEGVAAGLLGVEHVSFGWSGCSTEKVRVVNMRKFHIYHLVADDLSACSTKPRNRHDPKPVARAAA